MMTRIPRNAALAVTGLLTILPVFVSAQGFKQTNLVTDDPTVNSAVITDPLLKNAWGISASGAGPFWVSNNGTGTSTLYTVNATTNVPTKQALYVNIPGDGTVTGQVFNSTGGFNNDSFLFVSEDGTISGWRGALGTAPGTNAEILQPGSSSNVYKGSAIASVGGHTYLYGANFRTGTIDVLKGDGGAPTLPGAFVDPSVPSGYAPFNIQNIKGTLYVTYAKQDATKHDEEAGPGNGYVAAFDTNGNLIKHISSAGALNAPWGVTIAPASFGAYAGDLLVGNFGDGHINAFNLANDSLVGPLLDTANNPLEIDGLWALTLGNGGNGGSANALYFTAGPNGEANGLLGSLQAVPEPGQTGLLAAFLFSGGIGLLRLRRAPQPR